MGDMVIDIATNPELLARVNAFLDLEEEDGEKVIGKTGIEATSSSHIRGRSFSVIWFVFNVILCAL